MKKSDLPRKICPVCGLPFTWRKKWEKIGIMSFIAQKNVEEKKSKKM